MSERRYTETEIADIFAHAAQRGITTPSVPPNSGLTLAELQLIAQEVGLEPDSVAEAATRLNRAPVTSRQPAIVTRRHFWLPVEIGRTVDLPYRLSDTEWSALVDDLRSTFDTRGRTAESDAVRQWNGGGVQAVAGVGIVAATARRLKAWSRHGRQQFDAVVTRLFGSL